MATIETNIERALWARVRSLPLALPFAWPNKEFPGQTSTGEEIAKPASYIEVEHFPNNNERQFLDGADPVWRTGFIQLLLITPHNKGGDASKELAGQIVEHFPADLSLVSENVRVKISSTPDVARGYQAGVSWNIPVTVYYEVSA